MPHFLSQILPPLIYSFDYLQQHHTHTCNTKKANAELVLMLWALHYQLMLYVLQQQSATYSLYTAPTLAAFRKDTDEISSWKYKLSCCKFTCYMYT